MIRLENKKTPLSPQPISPIQRRSTRSATAAAAKAVEHKKSSSPKRDPSPPKRDPSSPKRDPSSPKRNPSSPKRNPSSPKRDPSSPKRYPSPPKRDPSSPKRDPSPPKRDPSSPKRYPSPPKRKPSPSKNDPYATPFWPPSDYSVPAKVIVNSPTPLPRTLAKHKVFIEKLRTVLINEKIIDRDNPEFKELLAEQQKYNMVFYRLKPHNIICFVRCDYDPHDRKAVRVFHKGNKEPYFGNFKFANLLKRNNMNMKWWGKNILYIHKNRF